MDEIIRLIIDNDLGKIRFNQDIKKLTSFGIGGILKYLYYPKDIDSLVKVIYKLKKRSLKYFILGNGTNLLFKDIIYEKLFIKLTELTNISMIDDSLYSVEAGTMGSKFVKYVINSGHGGCEFMSVIPGTMGGLIYMNASSYKKQISDYLEKIEYLDEEGNVCMLDVKNNLQYFSYRKSFFTNTTNIILKGYFRFPDDNQNSCELIKKYQAKKRSTQPLSKKSAGSTFRNFVDISAWKLIDQSGLRNFKIGDASVSEKHTNFLINLSNASFIEMKSLIDYIKFKVYKDSGYLLECELEIVEPC